VAAAVTGAVCNWWLSSEGLWHPVRLSRVLLAAWLAGLGGTWHLHVSVSLPFGLSAQVLSGSAALPWSAITAELAVIAVMSMRRRAAVRPAVAAAAVFLVNLALALVMCRVVSRAGGVALSARMISGVGLQQTVVATPAPSFGLVISVALVALAAASGAASRPGYRWPRLVRHQTEVLRVCAGSLLALGTAAAATWLAVCLAALLDPKFGHTTASSPPLLLLGAPAWMAQGLGLGAGAPMTVQATVLGAGTFRHIGMFAPGRPDVAAAAVMLVIILAAAVMAGRWYARGVPAGRRASAALIGVPLCVLLALWAANSNLGISGRLSSALAVIGQVLAGGLLGLVPIAGSALSKLAGSAIAGASRSGLTVMWAADPARVLLGSLILGSGGAWCGARSAPSVVVPAGPVQAPPPVAGPGTDSVGSEGTHSADGTVGTQGCEVLP